MAVLTEHQELAEERYRVANRKAPRFNLGRWMALAVFGVVVCLAWLR